jgi:hypothetical protein
MRQSQIQVFGSCALPSVVLNLITEPSRNDLKGDSRDLLKGPHGEVDTSKKKKK